MHAIARSTAITFIVTLATAFMVVVGPSAVRADSAVTALTPDNPVAWSDSNSFNVENPTGWFVELNSPPRIEGTSATTIRQEQQSFRSAAASAGVHFTERLAFSQLWNGLSIQVDKSQVSDLSLLPGVKAIYPVLPVSLPPTQQATPQDASSLQMIGADVAQSDLGYTGAGVKVGIIDTGIDYTHPDLGGCATWGSCTRVQYGYDFVGDAYNGGNTPTPDPDPMDCAGHGTHVAGIIGANAASPTGVTGVAPEVTFGAYRVFGCTGSTGTDIILAALERAYTDGMQVINMSLGSDLESWPQYPDAAASDRLVNHGVVVVAAAGNDGTGGLFSTGSPSTGSKVISVASYDNTMITEQAFSISPDNRLNGYVNAAGAPTAPTDGSSLPMTRTGTQTTADDACNPIAADLTGEAVLIRRGTCSFYIKASHAQSAHASAVVLYNNVPGQVNPTVAGSPPISIPVVSISQADGNALDTRLAGGPVTLTWTNETVSKPNPTGGLISSFSSYGLAADLSTKPDLGAPGGSVWSTYPLKLGGYANLSGTSMATPHVTGAVALLLQARPHTPANAVRGILQNTAVPKNWSGSPGLGLLDEVQRQGAGLIQIDKAIQATTNIQPGKLSLGASSAGPVTNTLTVTNSTSAAVTYDLTDVPGVSTTTAAPKSEFGPGFADAPANVLFSSPTVTVPAGGSASVTVTISPNSGLSDGAIYDGYLTFTPEGGGQIYRVPYTGYKGNYQAITYLTQPTHLFNAAAHVQTTFTMQSGDIPYVFVHLNHAARTLKEEVFDANTGKAWHLAFLDQYLPRNSTSAAYFALPFDGTTTFGKQSTTVPNGTYVIKLSVLKALGNDANPSDWETWTSPAFTIARP